MKLLRLAATGSLLPSKRGSPKEFLDDLYDIHWLASDNPSHLKEICFPFHMQEKRKPTHPQMFFWLNPFGRINKQSTQTNPWISKSPTRWFKPWPYYPRSLEVTNNLSNFDLRGHLTIPKRSPAARNPWFPTPPCGRSYLSTWGCQAASRRWRVLGFVPPWGGRKRRTTDFSDLRHTTWVFLQTPQKNKNIVFLSGCTTYLEDHLI